jgi:hypothetical protein
MVVVEGRLRSTGLPIGLLHLVLLLLLLWAEANGAARGDEKEDGGGGGSPIPTCTAAFSVHDGMCGTLTEWMVSTQLVEGRRATHPGCLHRNLL